MLKFKTKLISRGDRIVCVADEVIPKGANVWEMNYVVDQVIDPVLLGASCKAVQIFVRNNAVYSKSSVRVILFGDDTRFIVTAPVPNLIRNWNIQLSREPVYEAIHQIEIGEELTFNRKLSED